MLVFGFAIGMACEQNSGPEATWEVILDESLFQIVPKHWMTFKPPSKSEHFFLGSLYIILMSTGFAANGTIIILFTR